MKWSEISIHTTSEAVEPISNILHEAGASGVVIEDSFELEKQRESEFGEIYQLDPDDYPEEGVIIKAYFPVNSFLQETIDSIKESINNLIRYEIDIGKNKISISEIHEEDWATAWKQYYHPVKVSEKFTIVPTWEEYTKSSSDELIIELDPGMAFGTGTHPTTVLCIMALEKAVKKNDVVIDVGTGSGVLSIAAGLLGARKVIALDLDEVAVKAAKENVVLNRLEHIIEVRQNHLLNGIDTEAQVIVANILADVIVQFTDDVARLLTNGGIFIASGIIEQKKEEVKKAITNSGMNVVDVLQMEDWVAIIAEKR